MNTESPLSLIQTQRGSEFKLMQICSERVQPNAAVLDLFGKCQDNSITTPTSTLSRAPLAELQ